MTNLNDFGNEYNQPALDENTLLADPFQQFESWILLAIKNQEIEPNAMSLSTVNQDYQVTSRMMLLKYFDENGFVFFSNYASQKAKALRQIPNAAVLFWWAKSARQVRIYGAVEKLDSKHSDQYFAKRSKAAQCAALASNQSAPLARKEDLLAHYQKLKDTYHHETILRPETWGGYLLKPKGFEFWQGRPHRLHDRFIYEIQENKWNITRLSP